MTNSKGKDITADPKPLRTSVHGGYGCADCHGGAADPPHDAKSAAPSCLTCHAEAGEHLAASIHVALGEPPSSRACASCHGAHHVVKAAQRGSQLCTSCHEAAAKQFAASVHGQAQGRGNGDAPGCQDYHGPTHKIIPSRDSGSPVSKVNQPSTCGWCHSNPDFARQYMLTVAKPVEAYESSVRGRALRSGRLDAADCNDCHGVHNILPSSDPQSSISTRNVGSTCAQCHREVFQQYKESIHRRAVAAGVKGAPTCIDCHGEHRILSPGDSGPPVYVTNVSRMTCSRCHEDQRLVARLDLPAGRVVSFEDSFHGMAARAGSRTVANCASCHGVHNIIPSSDPRSMVAKPNMPPQQKEA